MQAETIIPAATNNALLEQYRASRAASDPKLLKMVNSGFLFNMYMLSQLPMGFVAGLKIKTATLEKCEVTVPYRWMNTNPFRSTYFAVLSMAAEMSTGMVCMVATRESKPSVSMLVTRMEAEFVKKATGLTTFTCNEGKLITEAVERAILTGQPQNFTATSVGTNKAGEVEARFKIQWSFKMRSRQA